jgi:SAM-dependent methyltransferase|mmetsp:Transcript_2324/g.8965  ORF Transcript_2324/g.8965 Transcript_2324/m.8965 type:complete len:293 (-) Transcript_2324:2204-3082(-)
MASVLCRLTAAALLSLPLGSPPRFAPRAPFPRHTKRRFTNASGSDLVWDSGSASWRPGPAPAEMSNDFGTFNKAASSAAAERNKVPIADVFVPLLRNAKPGTVVELACGTGQHTAHLAKELPAFTFQPTDLDDTSFASVTHHCAGNTNVMTPITVDATDASWSDKIMTEESKLACAAAVVGALTQDVAAVLIVNMTHISPWRATLGALSGSSKLLRENGVLFIYGPFKRDGTHNSDGNATFEKSLQERNPEWGYRDIETVIREAAAVGFGTPTITEMPANNYVLTMRKVGKA